MGTLEARVQSRLAGWEAAGLLPMFQSPAGLDFSSNDYLTLSTHPFIVQRFAGAVMRDGCGSTGSRLLRGDRTVFTAVEQRMADFKRTDRSLYFSSGYLANIAVMTTMTERGDVVFSDEQNHASLIDGITLSAASSVVFPHNDVGRLEQLLTETPVGPRGHRFVVVESLFGVDGDFAPLVEYAGLCRSAGASLIVDEAHAVGIYGARGSGLIEACGIESDVCVSMNAASTALGVSGAFVCGPDWAVDHLQQQARPFVFSTAAPPSVAEAIDASLDVIANEPERRQRLANCVRRLRDLLSGSGLTVPSNGSHIIPIAVGGNERALAVVRTVGRDGFDVRALWPPSGSQGSVRLRLSVNAGLSDDAIERFVGSLVAALKEVGFCPAESS